MVSTEFRHLLSHAELEKVVVYFDRKGAEIYFKSGEYFEALETEAGEVKRYKIDIALAYLRSCGVQALHVILDKSLIQKAEVEEFLDRDILREIQEEEER